jgi:hypothetical protein
MPYRHRDIPEQGSGFDPPTLAAQLLDRSGLDPNPCFTVGAQADRSPFADLVRAVQAGVERPFYPVEDFGARDRT